MKKFKAFLCILLCLVLMSASVLAAETSTDNSADSYTSAKISVSFKSGSGSYNVNGKTVKSEASVKTAGKTFVPVKVITDAIGASLKVDLKAKTAVINYNSVEIKLTDKKKEAVIAGKKVAIDAAPYIKNSSFMATITFLADTLGADITNSDGSITFVKEIANPNSIKDFGTLIKKTTKSKIGDSYYKWSMMLPDDLKLVSRNFNGTASEFTATDGSYDITLDIYNRNEDDTLDSISNDILDGLYDYTLIDYGIKTIDNVDFLDLIYKDSSYTYQERIYLSATREYDMTIYTENDNSYLNEKYQNILDSFRYKFTKDGTIEDLSDVNADGYRKYQETRLNWSVNLLPELRESKDKNVQNKVLFYGKDDSTFSVEIYSLDKGETLDSITDDYVNNDKDNYNPNLFTVTKRESAVIGGAKCNKVYYSIKVLDETYYGCDIFFVDKNYKYLLWYEVTEDTYKNSNQFKMVEGMINSFAFKELNTNTVGKLLDPNKVVFSDKKRTVSNDTFSMQIPIKWKSDLDSDSIKSYSSDSMSVKVTTVDKDGITFNELINKIDESLKGSNYRMETNTITTEKGLTCKKYVFYQKIYGIEYRVESYMFEKGDKIIIVDIMVNNLNYGPKNSKILSDIWQSFTFK